MDFEIAHSFDAPPGDLAATLLDVEYQNSLRDLGPLGHREVLEQDDLGDGRVRRRIRCVLGLDISGAARKFLGDADPAWVEEATWDPEALTWEWRIQPEVAADMLASSGRIEIGEIDGGAERRVSGIVQVRVPLYGGRVEGWIVDGLRRAYEEEAIRLAAWLS